MRKSCSPTRDIILAQVRLSRKTEGGDIVVSECEEGSPAAEAGIDKDIKLAESMYS